jgi:hypothetical protein
MGGALEDLERRIDQARMEAQQKKLQQAQQRAAEEAKKLQKQQDQVRRSNSLWL